jgi:CBS domain-containing protein
MQVKDIMTKDVISVSPETKIGEVAHILTEKRFHGLPVVENGKLMGIIVEDDFFVKDQSNFHLPSYINFIEKSGRANKSSEKQEEKIKELLNVRAKDIMTSECLSFSPQMEIKDILRVFKETRINTFPVIDERDNIVGIITLADVLSLI